MNSQQKVANSAILSSFCLEAMGVVRCVAHHLSWPSIFLWEWNNAGIKVQCEFDFTATRNFAYAVFAKMQFEIQVKIRRRKVVIFI